MKRGVRVLLIFACLVLICCRPPVADQSETATVLLWDEPTTLNPNQDFDSITDSILFNVFEPLVALDRELHLVPALAVGWENPDPEVWRFHLRPGVRFHDGTPLTAQIVRDSLLLVSRAGYETSNILSPVEDIRTPDNHTIDLVTRTPSALLSKLPFIYIFKENKEAFPPFLGTGPYRLVRWDPAKLVRLQVFDGYWGPRPELTGVRFQPVREESERMQMLADGRADIIYYFPVNQVQNPGPGISVIHHTGLTVYYLGFDLQGELADQRIRRAIQLAIDRKQIIRRALLGNGSIPTQPVAPFVFGYDPEIPPPEFNREKARQLLTEAGFAGGFSLQFDYNRSRQNIAVLIRNDLADIGIRVTLNAQTRNTVYQLAEAGKSRMHLIGWDCSSGDASEFYEFNLHTPNNMFGQGNYGKYSNPEMDDICERHSFFADEMERRKRLQEANRIAMRDLPVIPLYIEDDLYGVGKRVTFEPRADGQVRLADVKWRK